MQSKVLLARNANRRLWRSSILTLSILGLGGWVCNHFTSQQKKNFDFHERFVHHTMLNFHELKCVNPPLIDLLVFQKLL